MHEFNVGVRSLWVAIRGLDGLVHWRHHACTADGILFDPAETTWCGQVFRYTKAGEGKPITCLECLVRPEGRG